jgi:hypothetical protein
MIQKNFVEKIKTPISCSKHSFFFENRAVYEIMWENIVERGRPQKAIWLVRFSRRVLKPTNTYSEYVIIIAFFFGNNVYKNAPQFYISHTFPAFFSK